MVLLVAVIAAVVAGLGGSNTGIVPPTTPPSTPPGFIPPAGQIFGIDYWMAPPAGSERFLDRLETPLGDRLQLPGNAGDLWRAPVRPGGRGSARWNGDATHRCCSDPTPAGPGPTSSCAPISTGQPLEPRGDLAGRAAGRVPAARRAGHASTPPTRRGRRAIALPAEDIRSVSWLENSDSAARQRSGRRLSRPGRRLRRRRGASGHCGGPQGPVDVTAPYRLDGTGASGAAGTRSNGTVDRRQQSAAAGGHLGRARPSRRSAIAARMFIANQLPQVPTVVSQPQVVAAISTLRDAPQPPAGARRDPSGDADSRPGHPRPDPRAGLLLRARLVRRAHAAARRSEAGCSPGTCSTGRVRRVTELDVTGVALGPGIRGPDPTRRCTAWSSSTRRSASSGAGIGSPGQRADDRTLRPATAPSAPGPPSRRIGSPRAPGPLQRGRRQLRSGAAGRSR